MMYITQKNNQIKYCRICNCELILCDNWAKSREKCNNYICKECSTIRANAWAKSNPENVKIINSNWRKNNYNKVLSRINNWKDVHPEKVKLYKSKSNTRRRGLGDIFLFKNPFNKDIPVVGHHISDGFEVYIPVELHLKHLHGKNIKLHRDELEPYIELIYNISYIIT